MNQQAEFDFNAVPPSSSTEERREASKAILERIKKLLRLAADKRGNPHEAERAAQLAFELASRYHVDLAALDLDDESEAIAHEFMHCGERLTALRQGVLSILLNFFHVGVCVSKPRVIFAGRPTDIAIAKYVHDFLLRAGTDCLKAYDRNERKERRRMTTAKRAGFIAGFIYGVVSTLQKASDAIQLDDAKAALIVAEEQAREAEMDKVAPNRQKVKRIETRKNKTALAHGFHAGRATKIQTPIGGGGEWLAIEG